MILGVLGHPLAVTVLVFPGLLYMSAYLALAAVVKAVGLSAYRRAAISHAVLFVLGLAVISPLSPVVAQGGDRSELSCLALFADVFHLPFLLAAGLAYDLVLFPLMLALLSSSGGDWLSLLAAAGTLALSAAVLCGSGLFYRRPLPELVLPIAALFGVAAHRAVSGGTVMPVVGIVIFPLRAPLVLVHRLFRLGGAIGVVGGVAERQDLGHQIFHIVGEQVVFKLHIAAVDRHSVSILGISDRSGQEKLVAHVFTVAVGHIHQIVLSLQANYVPHMRRTAAGNSVSDNGPYCGVAGCIIKSAQVAEILEGLGIALAHHIGAIIPVKHIYYLPGVAVQAG